MAGGAAEVEIRLGMKETHIVASSEPEYEGSQFRKSGSCVVLSYDIKIYICITNIRAQIILMELVGT